MIDWVRGDLLGLDFPAHAAALRAGGVDFLTRAFRAAGVLGDDNRVARITRCETIPGGSTGSKLLLSVAYAQANPTLDEHLFVKFSRDFNDDIRDRARYQMEREVGFALLSRAPGFPITVATCYFADFHRDSGTGILVTRRVGFDRDGVEPHQPKCLDYQLAEPLGHYRALVRALARLAGTHRAGRLPAAVERDYPFDREQLAVSRRQSYTPEQIRRRIEKYAGFAAQYPQLLPANIRAPAFIDRLQEEAPALMALEASARRVLEDSADYIALCHWNANIDNAWFWREASGELACGLLDWGNVTQLHVAMALWGCLSAAETRLWDDHSAELLALFAADFSACGGPRLDEAVLREHLLLYMGIMGLNWMLDAPSLILARVPDLDAVADRRDARFSADESARSQLQILTVFLNLWETSDMAALIGRLGDVEHAATPG